MSETTRTRTDAVELRPRPQWWGILVTALLVASTAWFMTYALLDLPWQQRIGGWNYLIGFVIILGMLLTFRAWRGDPRDGWRPGPGYREQVRRDARAARRFFRTIFSRY
jgi:hypothetical protein